RFHVIRWDMLGHGRSDAPNDPQPYSRTATIADMCAVLDACGEQQAVLVGLSIGGFMSVNFAIARPERTAALVVVGAGAGGAAREEETRLLWNQRVGRTTADLERHGLNGVLPLLQTS